MGKEYKFFLLESRKQRLYNQLIRKCCAIDDLFYTKDQLFDSLFSQSLLLRK